jgi:Contractile injection system tape measure protein
MLQEHTIKKFSVELQMEAQQNAYALQRRCVQTIKENILPQIDSVLSAHFSNGETVLINRIEIDLGTIKSATLEKEFIQKYVSAFSSKIKEIKTGSQLPISEVNITDEDTATIKQFLCFLATGKMPWASYNINFNNWQQAVLTALPKKTNEFKAAFTELLATNETAAERLVNQFDDNFIEVVISLYAPALKDNIIRIFESLHNTMPVNYLSTARVIFYKAILFYITGESNKTTTYYLADMQFYLKNISEALLSKDALQKLAAAITALFKTSKIEGAAVSITNDAKTVLQKADKENTVQQQAQKNSVNEAATDAATYITNAGIILLHPYLKTFFTAAGLLNNEDDFKDEYCKQKAVHLLQYAATAQQQLPEYMLILNKLLCGIPGATHIDRFIELTTEEMAMANELLQAVINNWAILGNTSVTALQETFLQRKAKLFFNEAAGHWQLQVERTGLDVLLDKIPWGFAYVKLPWMPQAIITDW